MDEGRFGGRQPQAVRNALSVLSAVARLGPGVTVKQVAGELAMPAATAYRVIALLVAEEYLVRLPDLRGLALGARMEELLPTPAAPVAQVAPAGLSAPALPAPAPDGDAAQHRVSLPTRLQAFTP